jgi:tetratricopeptide (TPR) repeat protein
MYLKLSAVLERSNRMEDALEAANKAISISPDMPDAYHRKSTIHFYSNDMKEALQAIEKALELKPDYPLALATKSEILQSCGDMEGAKVAARTGLDLSQTIPFLYFTYSKLVKFTKDDEDFKNMRDLINKENVLGKFQTLSLHYSLYKAYQDIGDDDEAFEHLRKGADIKFEVSPFDSDLQQLYYDSLKQKFDKKFFQDFNTIGSETDAPIFIVGMPRSGTTLTEQIIASHPKVFGAGELHFLGQVEEELEQVNPDNVKEMAELYLERARSVDEAAKDAQHITDKMPGNYMRIGQIAVMYPNAKIIHCRRNPADTCLSCYQQLFARGHYWSYDWDAMVEHYKLYHDMMEHWRDVLPGRFLDFDYEDTVNDFENQARKLIDYVGLEWDDACLKPHKNKRSILTASKGQVRKPIYKTSVEKWRQYEKYLAPYAEQLEPYRYR